MEIRTLEDTTHRLVFQLVGADHTFCNALKKELVDVTGVEVATYAIEHPQVGIPKFLIETKGKMSPRDALHQGVKNLLAKNKAFITALNKELK